MSFDFEAWFEQDAETPMVEMLVWKLERTRRVDSKPLVRALLRRTDLPPKVAEFLRRISNCGRWTTRPDRALPYRFRCKHPLCPSCQPLLKIDEAKRVLRELEKLAAGKLDWKDLSWVTVNGAKLPLGSDFKSAVVATKTKLRNIRNRQLPETVWSMGLHIAVQENGTLGMEHLHGVVWHPGVSRRELRKVLADHVDGSNATKVLSLKSPNLRRNLIYGCGSYMADQDLRMKGYGCRTPDVLASLVHSYESVRTRGRMGIRFEIGIRKANRRSTAKSVEIAASENDQKSVGHTFNN